MTLRDEGQARREVAVFIDVYNHRHRHSSCEMLPPVADEQLLAHRAAEAAEQDRAASNRPLRSPQSLEPDPGWHQGGGE